MNQHEQERMSASKPQPRKPNPIDIHVGQRVKLRRSMAGMSQEKLGEALGVTFQQIQKYEKGANRISMSRMSQIAEALGVSVAFFLEDAPVEGAASSLREPAQTFQNDFLSSPEGIQLNRAFVKIRSPKVRKRILELVRSLGEDE